MPRGFGQRWVEARETRHDGAVVGHDSTLTRDKDRSLVDHAATRAQLPPERCDVVGVRLIIVVKPAADVPDGLLVRSKSGILVALWINRPRPGQQTKRCDQRDHAGDGCYDLASTVKEAHDP